MAKGKLTAEQKKLDADIGIIAGITLGVFLLYCLSGRQLRSFVLGGGASLPLRLLASAGMQFGLAGLGITVVCILRREPFSSFGLQKAHTIRAIAGTALCFLPYLGYLAVSGQFDGWQPFDLLVADQVFDSGNPWMVLLGMGLVILVWGFFEGFNYAVIAEKINRRYPSHRFWLDYGALICALVCLLLHPLRFSLWGALEIITTFLGIYGMLLVRKRTGNAWGCVFAFCCIWNAF